MLEERAAQNANNNESAGTAKAKAKAKAPVKGGRSSTRKAGGARKRGPAVEDGDKENRSEREEAAAARHQGGETRDDGCDAGEEAKLVRVDETARAVLDALSALAAKKAKKKWGTAETEPYDVSSCGHEICKRVRGYRPTVKVAAVCQDA